MPPSQNIVLIEVAAHHQFIKGHIPNAINLWRPDYGSSNSKPFKGMRANKEELSQCLRKIGFTGKETLIIYDKKGSVDAMRFSWMLELYGNSNFKILNGGYTLWKEKGYPIETGEASYIEPSDYSIPNNINTKTLATFEEIKNILHHPEYLLVDTREIEEYRGDSILYKDKMEPFKPGAFTAGHIPGAIRMNWSELVDLSGDHRIKSLRDLEYNLETKGITRDKNIILYCQSGSRSSHTSFVLRNILGFPNVKNYDGSWIEWSYQHIYHKSVDIETGPSPEIIE